MGEEAEMLEIGPIECSARNQVAQFPSKEFSPYSPILHHHPEFAHPAFGLLKSDNIDRKMNTFVVRKAGDGNIRLGDVIFSPSCLDQDYEKIVRSIKVKVVSGGLKDFITVCFLPQLEVNIHNSKPPEDAQTGCVVFQFKKQQVIWKEGEKKLSKLLPSVGTNDTLHFVISSFRKVRCYNLDLFLLQRPYSSIYII